MKCELKDTEMARPSHLRSETFLHAYMGRGPGAHKAVGGGVRPHCTVRPYSTAILGFLGTAVRVRVRPKIIAVRRTILSLQFLMIFSVLQTGSLGFWVTFFNLSTS